MDIVWDGITDIGVLGQADVKLRHKLADAGKNYDWSRMMDLLNHHPALINTTRPGGVALFAPLHQAAHGGAPADVIEALIRLGAWRTLQNARGERPLDVAERCGHLDVMPLLQPALQRRVPQGVLLKIQSHFHAVILGRAAEQVRLAQLRLPELEPLLEVGAEKVWFAVPGMYGGFSYQLRSDGVEAVLMSESWCRVVGGSGQRHAITSAGSQLVEEGFV